MKFKKLLFLMLFALLAIPVTWAASNVYVKVTSANQLVSGKKYILVSVSQNGTRTYLNVAGTFSTTFKSKSQNFTSTSTPGTYASNNLDAVDIAAASNQGSVYFDGACELTLNGTSDNCTFALPESYNDASGATKYIARGTRTTSNLMASETDATIDRAQWRVVNDGNGFVVYNNKDTQRLIAQTSYSSAFNTPLETAASYKAYLYVQGGESVLNAQPNPLDISQNPSGTLTIDGSNLLKDVSISTSSTGFSVEPKSLALTNHGITDGIVTVSYSGTKANATGTVTVRSGNLTQTVTVNAQAQPGTLEVSTETLDLGTTGSGTFTVTGSHLTNTSTNRVRLSIQRTSGSGTFLLNPTTIIPENGAINEEVTVTYSGNDSEAIAIITITATDAYETLTKTISVTAQAPRGSLEATPDHLDLGTSGTGTFTVNGSRLENLVSNKVQLVVDNSDFKVSPSSILPINKSINDEEITVTFTGVTESTGTITITAIDGYGELTKTVTVAAQAPQGTLEVSTEALDLGSEGTGTFTVNGKYLTSATIAIERNSDDGFSIDPKLLNLFHNALDNKVITVTYSGTAVAATAYITITATDAYNNTLSKTVTVTASALPGTLDVSTETLNLGTNYQGTFNVTGSYLVSSAISIDSNSDDGFSVSPSVLNPYNNKLERTITVSYDGSKAEATAYITITATDAYGNTLSKTVTVTALGVPGILEVSTNTLNIDGSGTFSVSGESLTQDVTISLKKGSGFRFTPSTIKLEDDGTVNGSVLVTYGGTSREATATLVVTSERFTQEVQVNYVAHNLFTTAGDYYVRNVGNNKYVVITGQYEASASCVSEQDADVITLGFKSGGIVSTMKQKFGDGDLIAILETVKSVLKEKLTSNDFKNGTYDASFVDQMFNIKLVKTGDENGSIYFCFDIPAFDDVEDVRTYLLGAGISNQMVKDYLNVLLQPGKRIYLNATGDNGVFGFTDDNTALVTKWMVENSVVEDDLFTTAGDYYVNNKGNNNYVVIDAENYNATASAGNQQDADIITLDFDDNGIVSTMKKKDSQDEGNDMIAVLEHVKTVLKNRLDNQGLSSDFVDDMFKIKLVKTGDSDGSMYFCFDIPKISNIDAVRDFLLNEADLPAIVTGYLDVLLQPGKRIYLNATGNNGTFGFTKDKNSDSSKWMAESAVVVEDDLFTTAGDYYVSNKGNNKYVVVTDEYNASASVDNEQDADVISLDFDTDGFVSTMKQKYGSGNIITMLDEVKSALTQKLQQNNLDASFVDEMFKIKLIKTGDEDGSIYFCFDIPEINNITQVLEVVESISDQYERVKNYLRFLLQPGKRIYLCVDDLEQGTFSFTKDSRLDAAKWMVEAYVTPEDDLFTTAGDYYVSNKGNNNYVVIDAENYNATASASSQQDADIITLDFDDNGIVSTMKQKDGEGEGSDLIAVLEHVKTVLKNRLNGEGLSSNFVDEMFKIKLVKTGDEDGSMYFCFDIPSIDNINAVRDFLLNEAGLPSLVTGYLDVLLQPGKRIYLNATVDNGTFGFTKDKRPNTSKWMVVEYVEPVDDLFTEAGNYYVSNKGNNKYVVIDAENYNATASVGEDDADVITIDFDEDGVVSTMKNYDGDGDLLAILDQVKSELRNRIPDDINTDFLDEMFKIKLVKTGDDDGSIYFCFDIPQIDRLDEILAVVNNINNDRVKDYLNKLLQPGKRIYLYVDDLEQGTFNFTKDNRLDAAKWMALSVKQTDRWTVIYFDMETANQYDYYFQAWDETDGADNPYNYFENKPGVKVTSLPTTKIGKTKTVYEFSYRYKSKEPRLILTMGEGQHQTAEITPKTHEIFYYYGGDEYVYNDSEPRTEPSYTIGVPVDEVIFPDEGFRQYMKDGKFGKTVDGSFKFYDNDPSNDVFEPWEIEKADILTATTDANVTIKDLTGIEYFTNLKEISLTGGRLSESSYLTLDFEILDLTMLQNNTLEKISVSNADKMTTFELPEGHPLKSLRLSYCDAMPVGTLNERLATYSETLEELRLQNCKNFAELDITENNKLKILEISSVPIPSLDLNGKNYLEVLSLSSTNITNDINEQIADKSKLRELSLSSNNDMQGTTLNIANKPDFESLRVHNQDNYATIAMDNAAKPTYMAIDDNDNLTTLTLPTLTAMVDMWIERNPNLEGCTVDLSGNTSLEQININSNGSASTIKGMSSEMTDIRYVNTEHQRYDGNVLDLSNCANLHYLDVIDCDLDRISVDGCTALGTKIPGNSNDMTLLVYGNHLRALDLEGVTLPYNFNVSPGADGLNGINKYFMSGDYVYHAGYNSQSVPTIKPRVGYVFHEYYNTGEGTNSYTYMVYVSLASGGAVSEQDTDQDGEAVLSINDLFRNWRAESMAYDMPQSEYNGQTDEELIEELSAQVADSGFDHNRVKLWKRFSENHPNTITTEARHGKGDELVYVHGTKGATTNSVRPRGAHEDPADWEIDPAEVKGDILVLGVYTVPVGVNEAVVSGKVSYLYGTRSDAADPEVENGDFVTENEEINFYKDKTLTGYNAAANTATGVNSDYDNTFPVEFKWEVTLTDKPDEIITNIEDLNLDLNREVAKVSYVNMMGVESDRPFEGVNIVVTRYTDGSVTTTKIIK